MKEIDEAYAVLSNPGKKLEYYRLKQGFGTFARDRFKQTHTDEDIFRNSDINRIFEELSRIFGFSRPEDIFSRDSFYGRNYREFKFKGPGFSGGGFFFFGTFGDAFRSGQAPARQDSLTSKLMSKGLDMFQKMAAKRLGIILPVKGRDLGDSLAVTPDEASSGGKVRYMVNQPGKSRGSSLPFQPGSKRGRRSSSRAWAKRERTGEKTVIFSSRSGSAGRLWKG